MFGYSGLEWLLIGGVVFFLLAIPTAISAWVWWLARKSEKAEGA